MDNDGGLELSHKLSWLLSQNWIAADELMGQALFDSNLGSSEILETSDRERKSWVLLVYNTEEFSSTLTLQIILHIHFSLKYSGSNVGLSAHAVTGGGIDVECNHISWSKLPVVNSLLRSLVVDNAFISVNQVLLDFVREHTLHWGAFVIVTNSFDCSSDLLIGGSSLDQSGGGHEGVVGSQDNISLLALGLATDDNGVSGVGGVTIDVGSEFNLDDILGL